MHDNNHGSADSILQQVSQVYQHTYGPFSYFVTFFLIIYRCQNISQLPIVGVSNQPASKNLIQNLTSTKAHILLVN